MGDENPKLVQVNVRDIPVDVKQRADDEARRLGFRSVHAFVRIKIYELAGEA